MLSRPSPSLRDYTEWMKGLLSLIPDGRYEIKSFATVEERRNVAAYGIFRGTHTGEGGSSPPTGRVCRPTTSTSCNSRRQDHRHDEDLERCLVRQGAGLGLVSLTKLPITVTARCGQRNGFRTSSSTRSPMPEARRLGSVADLSIDAAIGASIGCPMPAAAPRPFRRPVRHAGLAALSVAHLLNDTLQSMIRRSTRWSKTPTTSISRRSDSSPWRSRSPPPSCSRCSAT